MVWPWANRADAGAEGPLRQRGDLERVAPGQFQTSSDGSARVLPRQGHAATTSRARTSSSSTNEHARIGHLGAQRPDRARIGDDRFLRARATASATRRHAKPARRPLSRVRDATRVRRRRPLLAERRRPAAQGASDASSCCATRRRANQGELAWRLGLALGGGELRAARRSACRASTRARGRNWNLLFALFAFVVYYNLINLAQSWVASGRVGIGAALLGAARRRVPAGAAPALVARAAQQLRRLRLGARAAGAGGAHEDDPPAALPSTSSAAVAFVARRLPRAVLLLRLRRRAGQRRHSSGYTRWHAALLYVALLRARPPLRAAADRGADRHASSRWRGWPSRSEYTILRTSGLGPARALRCWPARRWCSAAHLRVGDYVAPAAERAAQLLKARFEGGISDRPHGRLAEGHAAARRRAQLLVNVGSAAPRRRRCSDVRIFEFDADGRLRARASQRAGASVDRRRAGMLRRRRASRAGRRRRRSEPRCTDEKLPTLRWPTELIASGRRRGAAAARHACRTVDLFELHPAPGEQRADRAALRDPVLEARCSTRSPAW